MPPQGTSAGPQGGLARLPCCPCSLSLPCVLTLMVVGESAAPHLSPSGTLTLNAELALMLSDRRFQPRGVYCPVPEVDRSCDMLTFRCRTADAEIRFSSSAISRSQQSWLCDALRSSRFSSLSYLLQICHFPCTNLPLCLLEPFTLRASAR